MKTTKIGKIRSFIEKYGKRYGVTEKDLSVYYKVQTTIRWGMQQEKKAENKKLSTDVNAK